MKPVVQISLDLTTKQEALEMAEPAIVSWQFTCGATDRRGRRQISVTVALTQPGTGRE